MLHSSIWNVQLRILFIIRYFIAVHHDWVSFACYLRTQTIFISLHGYETCFYLCHFLLHSELHNFFSLRLPLSSFAKLHREDNLAWIFEISCVSQHSFSAVIHFAGLKAVGESVQQPLRYYKVNLTASMNLIEVSFTQLNVQCAPRLDHSLSKCLLSEDMCVLL